MTVAPSTNGSGESASVASLATLLLHEKATSDGEIGDGLSRLSLLPYLIFIQLQIRKNSFVMLSTTKLSIGCVRVKSDLVDCGSFTQCLTVGRNMMLSAHLSCFVCIVVNQHAYR